MTINSRKKILFLLPRFPEAGGIETMTVALANYLAESRYNVAIAARDGDRPFDESKISKGVKIYRLYDEFHSRNIVKLINEKQFEIVINQGCVKIITPILKGIRELTDARIISVLHTNPRLTHHKPIAENEGIFIKKLAKFLIWPLYEREYFRRYRKNLNEVFLNSDFFVVLSQKFIGGLKKLINPEIYDETKLEIIPNFLTSGEGNEGKTGVVEKEKTLLYVGRIVEHTKRLSRIIRIWEQLTQLFPEWKLDIIGEGPDRKRFEALVRRRGIKRITFRGQMENVTEILKKSSILLQTSDNEGMPRVIMEAQSEGCVPVAYNSYPVASELIEDGESGVLIEPFKEGEFKRRLQELMQSPEKLKEMSIKAMNKALERYNQEPVMKLWEEIISS